jgi:hypothetical protein
VRRAILVVLVLGAVPVTFAGATTGPATIQITDQQTSDVYIDQGAKGRGPGDLEIIRQSLFNRRVSSKPIGHADIVCTFLTSTTRACTGTYALPKGDVVTSGEMGSRLLFELAIVGGTELYDNARGMLVVTTTALKPRREVLVFRLSG